MRIWIGRLFLLLGAFFLIAAALGTFWAPHAAERTPLNIDQWTHLTGSGQKLDPDTGQVLQVPLAYNVLTQADPKKSDGSTVAFLTTSCLNIDQNDPPDCVNDKDPRLVNNTLTAFAADRHTALPVANQEKYVGDKAEPVTGLVNKWPFNAKKKTYPYWDETLQKSVDAVYKGERKIQGLTTYEYDAVVPTTDAEILPDTQGTYAALTQTWVEPKTGAFIDQRGTQDLKLPDGSTVLSLDVRYTPATVSASVHDAKANLRQLTLVTRVVPIAGLVLGVVLLFFGFRWQQWPKKAAPQGSAAGAGPADTAELDPADTVEVGPEDGGPGGQ